MPYVALLAGLAEGEQVIDIFSMPPQGNSGTYLFVTAGGLVKRSDCALYGARRGKNAALSLKDDDRLVRVIRLEAAADLLLVSRQAMAIRIHTDEIPVTGRVSAGVKGIALELGDSVCFAGIADEKSSLVLLSDRGYGKRIPWRPLPDKSGPEKGRSVSPWQKAA
jgi:DNA gyrase subunit A